MTYKPTVHQVNNSQFISFEGIEGSGKSSQIELLEKALLASGKEVLRLREPGGTDFGEALRSAILSSETPIAPLSEALLFASSRCQLLSQKIIPFLSKPDRYVIVDRYIDSSIAYQGFARKLGMQAVLNLHTQSPLNLFPHKTFYLKIDWEESQARQAKRGQQKDYFEKEKSSFYQELINGYNHCAKSFPERIKTIDGTKDLKAIHLEILKNLKLTEI